VGGSFTLRLLYSGKRASSNLLERRLDRSLGVTAKVNILSLLGIEPQSFRQSLYHPGIYYCYCYYYYLSEFPQAPILTVTFAARGASRASAVRRAGEANDWVREAVE
jgi:hypothetical protein